MIAPARRAAFRILSQIAATDAHSDDLLRTPEVDALSAQDRNLTTNLVLGTLRWQMGIDEQIRSLLARPDAKLSAEAATALRMGAYQLLYLDRVPAHAVIHDSVELVKQSRERSAAGMVNAVLRKISTQGRPPATGKLRSPREIAAAFAHPGWMVVRWAKRYGIEAAAAICRWNQEPAGATLRLDPLDTTLAGLDLEPGAFLNCARRVVRGDGTAGEAFLSGRFRMQDEASQLVAEIAAAASPDAKRVLDTCAAPGGKTAILAERLPDAEIRAVDVSRKRLDAMKRLFAERSRERLHFEVEDAAKLQLKPVYDLVLCDVPCSGTGTIQRNPEIRLRVSEEDLARQAERQRAILRAALAGLAPGGRLVYSTCSLEPEENEKVVEAALRATPGARAVAVHGLLDRLGVCGVVTPGGRELLRGATDGPSLRTIPGLHACDGFFAAVLERT